MKPNGYKEEEFIHFIRQNTGEYVEVKSVKDSTRKHPKYEMYEIPFASINTMQLDKYGENIPFTRNNVVNLERYILRYWQPLIGSNAVMLLLNLWEYCNRDEGVDICYPKTSELAELMGVSKPTITNTLKVLEENNFIIIIHRLNKLANNKETSPIFKLRQTVPLLSKEQVRKLPPLLQKKHDEYIEKFGRGETEIQYFSHLPSETKGELLSVGDKLVSKKTRIHIESILESEQDAEYLLTILPNELRETMRKESFQEALEKVGISKPVIDVFFENVISICNHDSYTVDIIVRTSGHRDVLKKGVNERHTELVSKAVNELYGEGLFFINYYTVKDYIFKILKG
jgi:DNA-binding transcriptional ArsR family regulator